jgi:hypothetical protein
VALPYTVEDGYWRVFYEPGGAAERKLKDMDIGRADKESEMEEQARGIGRKIWKRVGLWTKETAEIVMQRV